MKTEPVYSQYEGGESKTPCGQFAFPHSVFIPYYQLKPNPFDANNMVRRKIMNEQIAPRQMFLESRLMLGAFALSLAALFAACQSSPTQPGADSGTPTALAEELKPLQGHWEGEGAGGKCSISIAGNSLHYRNSAGWFKTTFILPAGTDPQQLHATIKECSPPSSKAIGTVVFAIFKIEDGTLLLAEDDMSDKAPKTFADALSRYNVKKVQPQKKGIFTKGN